MRSVWTSAVITLCVVFSAGAEVPWSVVLGPGHETDAAIAVALNDLGEAGASLGIVFEPVSDGAPLPGGNYVVVGDASRNRCAQRLAEEGLKVPAPPENPEGYAIRTLDRNGVRVVVIAGASLPADVYGLYWLLDRMRVMRGVPDLDTVRAPAVKIRMGGAWGRHANGGSTEEQLCTALRYGYNWVAGPNVLDLVPWNAEPEAAANATNRERARELIAYAHALHINYYAFSNEFTCHPSLLEECDATLNPCDPAFWEAVKEKYRRLFRALPELDGISVCNDDISAFWDRYIPFDLTREAPECDWSYTKRFHAFVAALHDVVVGEFDKTYFHFTWGLREHEVHCQPEVFRAIFNKDIPTKNLYLMPKITRGDRWWFQPYNATFNQTPHETVVLFETMNYYEGGASHIFPTFSGAYFQRGLQTFLEPEDSNVRGVAALAGSRKDDWGTTGAYTYALYRLMWEPEVEMDQVARDFCAIHFGPEAADALAPVYLRSAAAYKYGLHIEPISYGQFNSFLHMRVGVFTAEGYPAIDNGKGHLAFLRRVYLRCDPWRAETLCSIEQGLDAARDMREQFAAARPRIVEAGVAAELGNRVDMTYRLIETNKRYVETLFAYFDYMDSGVPDHREALARAVADFERARADFVATPGFGYQLFGVDVLLDNARRAVENREAAARLLDATPGEKDLERIIAEQQRRYENVLASRREDLVHFGHFEVLVDGQDMLELSGSDYRLVPIRWDAGQVAVGEIRTPLPDKPVTVIPKNLESRPMHPFVLEQPCAENGYTARVYLNDLPGGHGWMKFDLYYLPEPPEALGLEVPWGGNV